MEKCLWRDIKIRLFNLINSVNTQLLLQLYGMFPVNPTSEQEGGETKVFRNKYPVVEILHQENFNNILVDDNE